MLEALAQSATPPKFVSVQGVGSGTVAPGGTVFGSISGTLDRVGGSGMDGSLSFGTAFGDPEEGIGVNVSANITSVHLSDFGDSGFLAVSMGTRLGLSMPTYVSLGVNNIAGWGDSAANDLSASAAVTTFGTLPGGSALPVMVTLGLDAVAGGSLTPFGGVGVGFTEFFGASVSHDGSNLNLGVGFTLPGIEGLSGSVLLDDVLAEDGDRRATFSLSYSIPNAF
ncbi:MAG: hypothetical protein ACT4N9_01335 [Paracoccaceae bacterium]